MMKIYKPLLLVIALLSQLTLVTFAQTAPSWVEFVDKQKEGESATLPDYSYAGYHFSEKPIPDVSSWARFNVVDYGAIADDDGYDDAAIQATIDAAQASGSPAIVYFPSGRFVVSDDNNVSKWIQISRDSIVLKGSGQNEGGTEIFMDKMRVQNGHWQFTFEPTTTSVVTKAVLTASASRGDFSVFIDQMGDLEVGQTVHIYHKSEAFARAHFGDLELSEDWTRLFGSGGGMTVYEPHIISEISGDRLTFKNPIQADLPIEVGTFAIRELTTIQEVGVEDILFTSNWENYGESFVHHKDDIHDYGWNAVKFGNVRNGWIRNCIFRSWSQAVDVTQSIGVTIEDVLISGEKGHASINTRRGFGLLVKDCEDASGQHHGPNTGYQGVNTVYLRHKMRKDQSIDCHSGQPYATLIDDVQGGDFDQNGGPHASYPHHAMHLTFWNFRHSSTASKTYNFWTPNSRNGFTYALPLFIGFQSDTDVIFLNEGLNELPQQMVEPRSLFEAQLELRLSTSSQFPNVSFVTPGNNQELSIGSDLVVEVSADDPDGTVVSVSLYLNDELVRIDTEAPYIWGINVLTDPDLAEMSAGEYKLEVVAVDNSGNSSSSSIDVLIGSKPQVSFTTPLVGAIIEAGSALNITTEVTDIDGEISGVSLFFNDNLIRMLNSSPYTWGIDQNLDPELFNLASGVYIIRIEAVDNDALKTVVEREVIVNAFPTLSFTTPTDGQEFEFGTNIPVVALASDPDGEIEKVELYINDKFHRQELSAPFEWGIRSDADPALFNLTDGTYKLTAVAYDLLGSTTTIENTVLVKPEVIPLKWENVPEEIRSFPNPFETQFSINLASSQLSNLELFNIQGQNLIEELSVESKNETTLFKTDQLESGMYFLRFTAFGEKKLIRIIKL